jgi:hypothetical protein
MLHEYLLGILEIRRDNKMWNRASLENWEYVRLRKIMGDCCRTNNVGQKELWK